MRTPAWLPGLLLLCLASPLLAQEALPKEPEDVGAGALGYGLSELLKWLVPLVGAYIVGALNRKGSWFGLQLNIIKAALFAIVTTAIMYVAEYLNSVITGAPANWTGAFWEGLAAGIVATLLVRLGIEQQRDPNSATGKAP